MYPVQTLNLNQRATHIYVILKGLNKITEKNTLVKDQGMDIDEAILY